MTIEKKMGIKTGSLLVSKTLAPEKIATFEFLWKQMVCPCER